MRDIKKKYAFSIFFLTKTVWFVTFFYGKSILQNKKGYFKYIDSYSKVHTVNKNKKKYRDKDRFKYIDSYSKVHAVNRNKKKKYIDSYRRKKWLMCKQKTKKVYRFLQ